jgi:3-oxoadipate enol-lactonase
MQVKANGITFNCEVAGPQGAPWVAFSNSLATNLSMWDEQVALLADRFRILRYDQRGHGKTQATAAPYDFALLMADVLGLLDALTIDRAHFVGISMGGMTALGLAETHPERLRSIVPCDCSAASTPASAQQWAERIEIARKQGMGALVEPTVSRWFPDGILDDNPALASHVKEMIRTTPVDGYAGCASAIADFDFRPGLGHITRPTLVMVGTKDAMLAGSREAKATIPGAKLVEIQGAGHLSNLDGAADFNRALEEFLTSV